MTRSAPKHNPMRQLARVHTPPEAQPTYGQGRGGRPWRRLAQSIKERDLYTCQACGRVTEDGEVDHITPLAKGGTDDPGNLQWLCREPCHADKTAREMGQRVRVQVGPDGWPIGKRT